MVASTEHVPRRKSIALFVNESFYGDLPRVESWHHERVSGFIMGQLLQVTVGWLSCMWFLLWGHATVRTFIAWYIYIRCLLEGGAQGGSRLREFSVLLHEGLAFCGWVLTYVLLLFYYLASLKVKCWLNNLYVLFVVGIFLKIQMECMSSLLF